jgi:hypothetical protein
MRFTKRLILVFYCGTTVVLPFKAPRVIAYLHLCPYAVTATGLASNFYKMQVYELTLIWVQGIRSGLDLHSGQMLGIYPILVAGRHFQIHQRATSRKSCNGTTPLTLIHSNRVTEPMQ